jgi:DNA-3-methyladenine glycosylase
MLARSFYQRPTLSVARELVGCVLVHEVDGRRRGGRIVETEAYTGPADAASHARCGMTKRNAPMFGPPGYAYVYLIYGMHHCLNLVTMRTGFPAAVLIRALEPLDDEIGPCSGPGRLTKALGIDLRQNGLDVTLPPLYVERMKPTRRGAVRVLRTPRIGVDYAGKWAQKPWRFVDAESRHLSVRLKRESRR